MTNSVTITDIANIIAETNNTTKKAAKETVEQVLDILVDQLTQGNELRLSGFGIFSVKDVEARTYRNLQTGETIEAGPTKRVGFKAAKALKDAVKGE